MARFAFSLFLLALLPYSLRAQEADSMSESAEARPNHPEVWMAVLPADLLTSRPTEWDYVRTHVDGLKLWTQHVDQPAEQWPIQPGPPDPEALAKIITLLNANGIPLIIEKGLWPQPESRPDWDAMGGVGGPYDETYARRAADNELDRIRRIEALGGRVAAFDVDGPIRHLTHPVSELPGIGSMQAAADIFIEYMMIIHEQYPEIDFYALSNFPNFGYRGGPSYWGDEGWGDYLIALEAIIAKARAAGAPLAGFTVDNPYDYAIGEHNSPKLKDPSSIDWMGRILDIERIVHEAGLEFNLIINCERAGEGDMAAYRRETLAYMDRYLERGGKPDRWIVQSWYTHPARDEVVPESDPESFTGITKTVIERVRDPQWEPAQQARAARTAEV